MKTDVIIIGGGLVGLTMACCLGSNGIKVAIIEASDPKTQNHDRFDGRCSAIAPSSVEIFKSIKIWNKLEKHAGAIKEIYVTDNNSPVFLHFGKQETGGGAMGYMVENRFTRRALFEKLNSLKNVKLFAPNKYKKIEYGEKFVSVTLENKEKIEAKLLIAADGRNSKIREQAGIKIQSHDYKQNGIVCVIKHEKPHNGVAQERFLPAGPFAILPMKDKYHSSLVWTEKSTIASKFMEMNDEDFTAEVEKRFGKYLGKLQLASQRWSYPLVLTFARKYTGKRMCLLGDSAHAIHPVAGQGLNLSWRDVKVLSEMIIETKNLGLDIGGQTVLSSYQALRRKDNIIMIAATDGLVKLFSNDSKVIGLIRDTGLALVNKVPALKRRFVSHAMGK